MEKVSTITTLTTRRPKWQYQAAPPTPRILHLPRRLRRKLQTSRSTKQSSQKDKRWKLEALFDQEREFAKGVLPIVMVSGGDGGGGGEDDHGKERRERVEERESVMVVEEKWRFQAEMLRAECNLVRMEREIAVKKMERRRVQMERILRSVIQTLLSGRKKISDGKNAKRVLEEQILELSEKLGKLQRKSGVKNLEAKKCSNFDKQTSLLQRRLEKFEGESDEICVKDIQEMADEICVKDIQEMAEASLSIKTTCNPDENFVSDRIANMEELRKKMEGLSADSLLTRMEDEYRSMLSTTNNSAASSASTSKIIEFPDMPSVIVRQQSQIKQPNETRACSGYCKAIVRRVVEQVRSETEQWSQMQEILGQVRNEMEELQASRDFWEERALDSDYQIQSLQSDVQEWRRKALWSQSKVDELEEQVSKLQAQLEMSRKEKPDVIERAKRLLPNTLEAPKEMERRILFYSSKENHHSNDRKEISGDRRREAVSGISAQNAPKRSPFRDIGNSYLVVKQSSKARAVFPLHSHV